MDPEGQRIIPRSDQQRLLQHLELGDVASWSAQQRNSGRHRVALDHWHPRAAPDWLWSVGLPLLSLGDQWLGERRLLGLSALPGCGKTTLGQWIEAAAKELGLSIQVVSLDDFYFEAERLDAAISGNPWGVPRALPGSHDLELLQECLQVWRQGDHVLMPCFDKAKRQGRGDRSGWRRCDADLLIFEGWFVGCRSNADPTADEPHLEFPLTPEELEWRQKLQPVLALYEATWSCFDQLWQLRATDFNAPWRWKRQQEATLQAERGASLSSSELDRFIRMILCSLPSSSFQTMRADVVVEVDPDRNLKRIHLQGSIQDSPSSDSLTG
ncbi:phosphoribulokinase [Synechococcus sp. YX-04-1]|uniref:phosphoribulokinase n=1 Tax=Synechococcus sp. YX-04-1 TaxID=3062778 RepID=UPI0026E2BC2B|nr:phosphoribulokinase [Synechococcus sp. YX-04-1]MDO6351745.1 phosphoribulokinase [Synechococcus sp. YX-04-1]